MLEVLSVFRLMVLFLLCSLLPFVHRISYRRFVLRCQRVLSQEVCQKCNLNALARAMRAGLYREKAVFIDDAVGRSVIFAQKIAPAMCFSFRQVCALF